MDTEKKIKEIISEFTCDEPELISNDTRLEDIGLDSLDLVEMVIRIEEEYDINIPDNVLNGGEWVTVQDVIDRVTEATN